MVGMSLGSAVRHFNPRSPHGERHFRPSSFFPLRDFNPRSPHGERPDPAPGTAPPEISIHAPRTGSDSTVSDTAHASTHFNPRSPHGERLQTLRERSNRSHFNPRSPHGERRTALSPHSAFIYFNPRSPHGERRNSTYTPTVTSYISIHAPRTGSDGYQNLTSPLPNEFQSTLPARGATSAVSCYKFRRTISIHAPRTGSDHYHRQAVLSQYHFNPRSPHGERLLV